MDDFEAVWNIYPRKVAKAHARKMWARLSEEQRFAAMHALPVHVRYWNIAGRELERIPHLGSWIGGERWEDELEMPQTKTDAAPWWSSETGIMREGLKRGLKPRAGESLQDFKARVAMAPA
jgi:hypothetical protein